MKRKAQRASTHARVLLAAKDSFAGRDVRDVSMQDVAERAETSVGALYLHFRSRDLLLDAVVTDLESQLVEAVRDTLSSTETKSVSKAIQQLAAAYVSTLGELRPFISVYAHHAARAMSVEALRHGGGSGPLLQMVSATLGSLSASAPINVDVATLAASLVSLWRGAALAYAPRPARDERAVADSLGTMTEALLRGVCPRLFELDARQLTRAMAQFLKGQTFIHT